MLSWSQDQDKKIGTIFGQIDPRVPSGLIFKVFAQIFDAHSYTYYFENKLNIAFIKVGGVGIVIEYTS